MGDHFSPTHAAMWLTRGDIRSLMLTASSPVASSTGLCCPEEAEGLISRVLLLPHQLKAVGARGRAGQFSLVPSTTPWLTEALPAMSLSLSAGSPMLLSSQSTLLGFPREVKAPFSWLLQLARGWGEQNIYMRYSQMKLESQIFCMSASSHLMRLFIIVFVIVGDYMLMHVCMHDSLGTFAHVGARSWCQMSLPSLVLCQCANVHSTLVFKAESLAEFSDCWFGETDQQAPGIALSPHLPLEWQPIALVILKCDPWVSELRSSCLRGKPFVDWTITSAPHFGLFWMNDNVTL